MKNRELKIEFYEMLGGFTLFFAEYIDGHYNESDNEKMCKIIDDYCASMRTKAEKMKSGAYKRRKSKRL